MQKRTPSLLTIFLIVLLGAFLGSIFTMQMIKSGATPGTATPTYAATTPTSTMAMTGDCDAVVKVVERVGPAVVYIDTLARAHRGDYFYPFRGGNDGLYRKGTGSGVIVSPEGYILTNAHVIRGADVIRVTLLDKRVFEGKVLGTLKGIDLAILRIEAKNLPYAELADSDKARIGEWVVALGNPLGFDHTVTVGVLSGRGRNLADFYRDLLQTDAAINPGNSGGPLVDIQGRVIGINTATVPGAQGIGFAIPSNLARNAVDQVIATGRIRIPFLGVRMRDADPNIARHLGLPEPSGVVIAGIVEGSPAARARLQVGDTIVEVQGKKIETSGALITFLQSSKVGETVEFGVYRKGKRIAVQVTIGELDRELE
jgi:serine protease Do